MANVSRVGDMEIKQDLRYQRREWAAQRVGWAVMALLVLAALAGLLGRGPLSGTSAGDPDGTLRVEYGRFLHFHDSTSLRVHVEGGADEKNELRLWIGQEYLDGIEIRKVTPEPVRTEAGPDRHVFVFRVLGPGRPVTVTFHFEADRMGPLSGQVGVDGREPARISHFVYP